MTSLTSLKSDCTKALEQCIKDCRILFLSHKNLTGMDRLVELCQSCMDACEDCLDACESSRLDRGRMMHQCFEACKSCSSECEKYTDEDFQRCAASCNTCIEEFKHVMA